MTLCAETDTRQHNKHFATARLGLPDIIGGTAGITTRPKNKWNYNCALKSRACDRETYAAFRNLIAAFSGFACCARSQPGKTFLATSRTGGTTTTRYLDDDLAGLLVGYDVKQAVAREQQRDWLRRIARNTARVGSHAKAFALSGGKGVLMDYLAATLITSATYGVAIK